MRGKEEVRGGVWVQLEVLVACFASEGVTIGGVVRGSAHETEKCNHEKKLKISQC